MREIVFDTETTGLNPNDGHRLVEIGCVELFNRVETGRTFHAYYCPERSMPAEAQAVHGLSDAFLSDKPCFEEGVEELLDFLEDSPLVAHNAMFDFGFLNWELSDCGRLKIPLSRMVDTLALSRSRHPGAKHSLDALCSRFGIDRSHRVKHGALLDAQLLSQVYVELTGGRQIGFSLAEASGRVQVETGGLGTETLVRRLYPPRPHHASADELAAHALFLSRITDPLWSRTGTAFAAVG